VLRLNAPARVAHALERALLDGGAFVVRPPDDDATTPGILADAGALVLVAHERDTISLRIGNSHEELVPAADTTSAVADLLMRLRQAKVLHKERVQ
jgi:hypothetical protein